MVSKKKPVFQGSAKIALLQPFAARAGHGRGEDLDAGVAPQAEDQVQYFYNKGALFENFVLNEFIKRYANRGENRQP